MAGLCEADHSIPSSVKVNNECSYTPSPPYGFMACALTTLLCTSEGLKRKDRTKTMLALHSSGNADPGGRAI